MKYDPKDARTTLPPGDYTAELLGMEEKTSQTGKPMGVLQWRIYPDQGPTVLLKDWVVIPDGVWKLKKMSTAWNVESEFNDGSFNPMDYVNRNLIVHLKVKPADGKYGESNAIANYKPMQKEPGQASTLTVALAAQTKRAEADVEPTFAPDGDPNEVPFSWLIGFCLSLLSLAAMA